MQIENSFDVAAAPDRVFAFLLDVNRVVGCMPGAELSEVVDPTTFKGKVKIKVGPVTVAYAGTARIIDRDEANRTATLESDGRETTGPGSARAKAFMKVDEVGGASRVTFTTDFTVAGRVAQFGRGLMEDVSRKLIGQMADCIKGQLELPEEPAAAVMAATEIPPPDAAAAGQATAAPPGDATAEGAPAQPAAAPAPAPQPPPRPAPPATAPVNMLGLLWSVFMGRLRALFGGKKS
jgi:carbon monoxide dehydrogenase subunit G